MARRGGCSCCAQTAGQVTGQGALHPALAASLPGMTATRGGAIGPAAAPVAAPAPAAKPPVLGTPTFCLLVKNMFDPAQETEEGWELDIKEEMEEVSVLEGLLILTPDFACNLEKDSTELVTRPINVRWLSFRAIPMSNAILECHVLGYVSNRLYVAKLVSPGKSPCSLSTLV